MSGTLCGPLRRRVSVVNPLAVPQRNRVAALFCVPALRTERFPIFVARQLRPRDAGRKRENSSRRESARTKLPGERENPESESDRASRGTNRVNGRLCLRHKITLDENPSSRQSDRLVRYDLARCVFVGASEGKVATTAPYIFIAGGNSGRLAAQISREFSLKFLLARENKRR